MLIVIGSHGRSSVGIALLGSVANSVVHHSDIPVLVCHGKPTAHDIHRAAAAKEAKSLT